MAKGMAKAAVPACGNNDAIARATKTLAAIQTMHVATNIKRAAAREKAAAARAARTLKAPGLFVFCGINMLSPDHAASLITTLS